jgi:integrase
MARSPKPWWNESKGVWCSDIGGKRHTLARGRKNRKEAVEKLRALVDEQTLLADVNGAITVAGLCEKFLEDAERNLERKTYKIYQYGCQKFVDQLGRRMAHTITPTDISSFGNSLKKSLNTATLGMVLRSIRRCFNWGVEQRLIPPHRLGSFRIPRSMPRDRYVTDDEFRSLLRATNPKNHHRSGAPFRRLLLALDWTLCRPSELLRLKWEHVHWDRDVALLPDHKTKRSGKPKIIPLVPKMKRLLRWLERHNSSEYCFINSAGQPWTLSAVEQRMFHIKQRCGLTGVVPYTIRHRAATNAILRTGDLKQTAALLGHTSTATTERYTHLAQGHLVEFAKKAVG